MNRRFLTGPRSRARRSPRRDAPDTAVAVLGDEERAILRDATPTGRPQTSLSETTKPVMKSSTSPVGFPALPNKSQTTLYPGRFDRFQEPCRVTKALPLYVAGKSAPS